MNPITRSNLFLVISIYALIMFLTNSWWGMIETSEARYAEISREMLTSHDYLHPSLLSIHHYHKPPITYWLTVSGLSLFGVTPEGARFFLVIAYILQCLIVYKIALLIFEERGGSNQDTKSIWAAFIFSNLILVLVSMRALTTDGYNHLFILFTIWMALLFKKENELKWLYLTAIGIGLAFMTKGPVIALILIPVYLLVPVSKETPRHFYKIHFLFAFALACLIGLSWYSYLINQNEVFLDYFVMRHLVDRLMHGEVFMRHQPWYFYLLIFPGLTFPWIIPFIFSIRKTSSLSKRILLAWVVIPFAIFSVASSKLALYILPVCAGFALVTSDLLFTNFRNQKFLFLVGYLILVIALLLVPFFDSSIELPLMTKFVLGSSFLLLIILFPVKDQRTVIWYSSVVFTVTLLVVSALMIKNNALKFNSVTPIAEFIKQTNLDSRTIIVYDRLLPSLSFELNKPVISVYDNNSIQRETEFETDSKWKNFLFNIDQPNDSSGFFKLLSRPSVLVTKEELTKDRSWIVRPFKNQKAISGWTVYY
jgi:4-amino-4-deoxy-L-arabinose transferase-like glycosyltransferase